MRRAIALMLAPVALATACSGGGHKKASSAAVAAVSAVPAGDHKIGATFQYGSFMITLGYSTYDATKKVLSVGAGFTNIGGTWRSAPTDALLSVADRTYYAEASQSQVPPGISATATLTFADVESDPTPTGVLVWGTPDNDQPKIALADGHGDDLWRPAPIALDGWAQVGKFAVHVTSAKLLAAYLDEGLQAPAGQRVLRVYFDEFTTRRAFQSGFFADEHLSLRGADGKLVPAAHASTRLLPLSWTASSVPMWVEFPVNATAAGEYTLLLNSVVLTGYPPHPELISRVPVVLSVGRLAVKGVGAGPAPATTLVAPFTPPAPGPAVDVALHVPPINIPGFLFAPIRLRWDPSTQKATLDGNATMIERTLASGGLTGPALDTVPTFNPNAILVSGGVFSSGGVSGDVHIEPGKTLPVTLTFGAVKAVSATDVGLLIGRTDFVAASAPLAAKSDLPTYPGPIGQGAITSPPVTAGRWTVQLKSFRIGAVQRDPAPIGGNQLEITFDVTAGKDAKPTAFGLTFDTATQFLRAGADGYDLQPVDSTNLPNFQPGQTMTATVVFDTPNLIGPGRYGFVLRSHDEVTDVPDAITEVTWGAAIGGSAIDAITQ